MKLSNLVCLTSRDSGTYGTLQKKVSTKFTNVREQFTMVREQFAMVHELFMNLYYIGINGHERSF